MDQENNKPRRWRLIVLISTVLTIGALVTACGFHGCQDRESESPATSAPPPPPPPFAEVVPDVQGIDYVARINPGLYRGAYPAGHLEELKKLGIRTIINFRSRHDYREEAEAMGFRYYSMPMLPLFPPTDEQIDEFFRIVNDPAQQPVYIHCKLGVDRTGVMAGIYRVEHDGWTNERAVEEMEHFGHNEIWHELEEFLEDYKPRPRQ